MKFRIQIDRGKPEVNIGVLSYLKTIPNIWDLIYKYYPKRRKIFLERFHKQAIINKIKNCKGPIKHNWCHILQLEGIIDRDNNLTDLGSDIKETLVKFKY